MQDFQEDEKKNHDRIMLVEDDTTITRVLKRQLERWGYEVFDNLILRAEELRSALRNSIVRTLQESYPQACSHHCG